MPRAGEEPLLRSLPPDGVSSSAGAPPPPGCCSTRLALMLAVCTGIMSQTALRSVPNLVMNGEDGMAQEFGWQNAERGMVLSAFGWGYTLMQLPGGVISQLLGPRLTMFCFALLSSAAGLALPYGARLTFTVPLALNFVIGMGQAPMFPVLNGLLANWLRQSEMARGNSLMMAAWNLGQVIQFLVSPLLLSVAGWPSAWYVYAGVGGAWCLLWLRTAADTPESHPRISQRELDWINEVGVRRGSWLEASWSTMGKSIEPIDGSDFSCRVFCRILCQPPVAVLSLCSALDGLGGAFANWLPQYYVTQLKFDLQDSGVMTAVPMVVAIGSAILGGLVADAVLARGASLSRVRRWFNFVPTLLMAVCTLLLARVKDPTLVVAIMATQNFLLGFKQAGIGPVAMELSRKYAAVVMALSNTAQNLCYYALGNNLIGLLLDHGKCPSDDRDERSPGEEAACTAAWEQLVRDIDY